MPARHLAHALKMSTRHFFDALFWKNGIIGLVVEGYIYEKHLS